MIRTATPADHKAILQVAKQSKYTKDFSNQVMFSSEAAYAKGWIRVKEVGGEIVGFTCIREKVRSPETVLYFIGVHPKVTGCGIGQELIQDIMDRTKHRCMTLNVSKDNSAKQFYDKLGFSVVGESLKGTGFALKKEW